MLLWKSNHMSDLLEKAKIMSSKNTSNVNMNQVQSTKICPPTIPQNGNINAQPYRTVFNPIVAEEPIIQRGYRPRSMSMQKNIPSMSIPERVINDVQETDAVTVIDRSIDASMIPVNTDYKGINERQLLKEKSKRITILESLLNIYRNKHQIINGQVICKQNQLEELVRIYTDADSVEVMTVNDGDCGCFINDHKMYDIEGIIVNNRGKSIDLRFGFNDIYADIIRHGISLKHIIA